PILHADSLLTAAARCGNAPNGPCYAIIGLETAPPLRLPPSGAGAAGKSIVPATPRLFPMFPLGIAATLLAISCAGSAVDATEPADTAMSAPAASVKSEKIHKSTPTPIANATAEVVPTKSPKAKTRAKPKPPAHDPAATRIVDVAGLGEVTVYAANGEARGLALFASGDGAWNLGVWDMARTAADLGYWVAGFSTP